MCTRIMLCLLHILKIFNYLMYLIIFLNVLLCYWLLHYYVITDYKS